MFSWFRRRRRRGVRARPFPADWVEILGRAVPLYARLPAADPAELHQHVHVFLAEKRIEGCGGLQLTDEIRLSIAATACLLLLHRETDYFPQMKTVFVYPDEFVSETAEEIEGGVVAEFEEDRSGESWDRGPVVLSWKDVREAAVVGGEGYNVVLHEFAHQLDLENDAMDGVPRLQTRDDYIRWSEAFGAAYQHVGRESRRGRWTAIDDYGSDDPAEFFAVATESFFETPRELQRAYPGVYDALARYFRQNPATWTSA